MIRLAERSAGFLYRRVLDRPSDLTRRLVEADRTLRRRSFRATLAAYPLFCAASWAITLGRRALGLKPRVVWGPTPILTIADSSELLRRLGYPSTTVVYATYHIRSDFDVNLTRPIGDPALVSWLPNVLFLWSLLRFDVFHYFYDGGLWSGMKVQPAARWLELPLLRLAGKRVIASAYGADVRVRHLNELWQPWNICVECPEPGLYCVCGPGGLTRAKYHRDWCNVVLTLGASQEWVFDSRSDLNYWPIDTAKVPFVGAEATPGPVRVVHSPNHRYFKGTRYVEEAVASLRERGHDVELELVEGLPNEEARRRYEEADVVFAQCLAGSMGFTELEAMASGKPVLGYIRDPAYYAHTNGTPLVSATPATLEQELEALVTDPARREELGRRGREYVERWWSYDALAPAYDALHRRVWERNDLTGTLRRKWSDVVRGEGGYRVGGPLAGHSLREWLVRPDPFLAMRRIERGVLGQPPFDEEGSPRVAVRGRYVEHPGVVALVALQAFHLLLAEPESRLARARFLAAARRLRDTLDPAGLWRHPFRAPGREPGWTSCGTQGLGVSVLLRAAQLEDGEGFAEAAAAAAGVLRVRAENGGLLLERDGLTFLVDDPADPRARDIGRFATGIAALHEYDRAAGGEAAELFERCAETLARVGDGLRHEPDEAATVTGDAGHLLVHQLRALHRITGDARLAAQARRRARLLHASRLRAFMRNEAPL